MMLRKYGVMAGALAMTFAAGVAVGRAPALHAAGKNRVLEIRTYTTHDGRLPALVERMGHGEGKVFERLGMKPVLFSVAAESPKSQNTFVYILSHESLAKAKENWAKFRDRYAGNISGESLGHSVNYDGKARSKGNLGCQYRDHYPFRRFVLRGERDRHRN